MSNTKTPNFITAHRKKDASVIFGRIFTVCAVGIGVPRVKTLVYALFFAISKKQKEIKDESR